MGYQAESGQWRNFYLTGAQELRNGVNSASTVSTVSPDMIKALTLEMIFDFLAVRLNGPDAAGKDIQLNLHFEDSDEDYLMTVRNGVLKSRAGRINQDADASIRLTRSVFIAMTLAGRPLETLIETGAVSVEGEIQSLIEFLSLLDQFEFWFNIVTP